MKMTVAVPVHDMADKEFFLKRCLDSLWNQSFQDFDIVVADNSDDDILGDICDWYGGGITYYRNPRKGMAQNTNFVIEHSTGSIIKILYMDDYLAHEDALEDIWQNFSGSWLVTGCAHNDGHGQVNPHIPKYSLDIHKGNNTIGSPSVLTIKNDHPLLFDEEMTWLLDCDYYKRLYQTRGAPTILEEVGVIIGLGKHQMTNVLTNEQKSGEFDYLMKKYATK